MNRTKTYQYFEDGELIHEFTVDDDRVISGTVPEYLEFSVLGFENTDLSLIDYMDYAVTTISNAFERQKNGGLREKFGDPI